MNYDFPIITHISDVLPHIEDREEFRVMVKDWYTVINYVVNLEDTFPPVTISGGSAKMREERSLTNRIRRECRGLIFETETGKLISRPYHKFFNVDEKPETQSNKVNLYEPHVILEKLDGCCEENTILLTQNGEMTIKDICDNEYKGLVLGYNHTTNESYWTPVIGYSIKDNNNDWYEIQTEDGKVVKLTSNHKVLCVNRNSYVEVSNLIEGDEVLIQSYP